MIPRLLLLLVSMMLVTSAVLRSAKSAPPAGGLLVVANQKEHTLLVVDPDNRRELAKIAVGMNGHEVIVSKDSRFAYVPIYGNSGVGKPGTDGSTIDVIDLQERKLAATIDLGKPPLDEPKVSSSDPRDCVENGSIHAVIHRRVQPQLHPLTLDHILKLPSAQGLELMREANA